MRNSKQAVRRRLSALPLLKNFARWVLRSGCLIGVRIRWIAALSAVHHQRRESIGTPFV